VGQESSRLHSEDTRHPGNRWSRSPADGAWPLATDLGQAIGTRRWWTGLVVLCSGLIVALAIALAGNRLTPSTSSGGQAVAAEHVAKMPAAVSPQSMAAQSSLPEFPLIFRPVLHTVGLAVDIETPSQPSLRRERVTVGLGDTLMDVALRAGAERRAAYEAIEALRELFQPRRLKTGQALEFAFERAEEGEQLARLALRDRFDARVAVERGADGSFSASREALETTPLLDFASGTIESSLYLSARNEGLPVQTILELIRLYSFSVDFQRQIRPGDRFEVLYEREVTAEDGRVDNGGVVYAKLTLRGEELPLYRFQPPDEDGVEYFNADGESVRKALMKTPLDGARITSRFGPRKHPIQGYVRTHQGVDFGAPTGTPVYAAGDGVVDRASRYGGYGNYIRLRHNSTEFKTAYAHLSGYARGIRKGARVEQGQVIGYVGSSGNSTGPHLHYEIYRGDDRVDPLALDLPSGRVLEGDMLARFEQARARLEGDRQALAHARRLARQARQIVDTAGRQAAVAQ